MRNAVQDRRSTAIVRWSQRELSRLPSADGSVTSPPPRKRRSTHWIPPEGIMPEQIHAVIDAAACERDRLLLRTLWATGARISEVLALRRDDIQRGTLVLPNLKNPSRTWKKVALPGGQIDLVGELLLWAAEHRLEGYEPIFFSQKRTLDGQRRAINRGHAWHIVKQASERAGVQIEALRASRYGAKGEPAPVHPHLFRHARVRQILRSTKDLRLAQKQAGWARLEVAYLTMSDEEAATLMQEMDE
jgi:integrase/recombinase XerD